MEQFVKDFMTKLADFVVIWQFFRLVFGYKWFWQLKYYYYLLIDDEINNVIFADDIMYTKWLERLILIMI